MALQLTVGKFKSWRRKFEDVQHTKSCFQGFAVRFYFGKVYIGRKVPLTKSLDIGTVECYSTILIIGNVLKAAKHSGGAKAHL